MSIRTCLFFILSIIACSAYAQDNIYKKDGSVISAKVKSVGTTVINFKRYDNPDGPEYTILKREVSRIKYENGTADNFDGADIKEGHQGYIKGTSKKAQYIKRYGDNIISITPGAYTVSIDGTINDAGLGLCYERQLDEHGHISINLPFMINFSSSRDFNNDLYNYNGSYTPTGDENYHSFYIMPGIKFYPASGRERVRYSLGASFFAIFGSEPYAVYDNNNNYNYTSSYIPTGNWNYSVYGFMLSNSVNIAATKHLLMAIDLGMGIPVSDNRHEYNDDGLDVIIAPWMQFGLKIGYRF